MRKIGAVAMFAIAAFMALGFSISRADVTPGVTVFAVLLTIGLPIGVGIALLRGGPVNKAGRVQHLRQQTIDAEILRLATLRSARLTATEITVALGLNAAEVQQSLDAMVRREVADSDVTEDGVIVYTFGGANTFRGSDQPKGLLDG